MIYRICYIEIRWKLCPLAFFIEISTPSHREHYGSDEIPTFSSPSCHTCIPMLKYTFDNLS